MKRNGKIVALLITAIVAVAIGCNQQSREFSGQRTTGTGMDAGDLVFNVEGLT